MLAQRKRTLLSSTLRSLLVVTTGAALGNVLPGCGSSTSDTGTPGGTTSTAGTNSGGSVASGGAMNTSGGTGTAGVGASAGTTAGGSTGSGAGGTANGGASGSVGAATGGSAGSSAAGMGGKGGAGAGGSSAGAGGAPSSCDTPPPASALVGWASQSGMGVTTTTGGGDAAPKVVTSVSELIGAVAGNTPKVVYVKGVLGAGKIPIGSNTTLVGLCGAEIHGHIGVSSVSNIIVRNLKIVGYGSGDCALDPDFTAVVGCSSGNDAVTITSSAHHIWVDHCDISDGTDGNLDITQGSDFVTVSWTKFHYKPRTDNVGNDSTGAGGHRFSNLIGGADSVPIDMGHLNITWHHDWWADNVNQRMPRSRAGKIHLFNNLFTAKNDSYCSNAGQDANLLVENSVFDSVAAPFAISQNGTIVSKGNVFTNTTGLKTGTGNGFPMAPYAYTLDPTSNLEATIEANAGPH